jgi:hypothetical protein
VPEPKCCPAGIFPLFTILSSSWHSSGLRLTEYFTAMASSTLGGSHEFAGFAEQAITLPDKY